VLRKAIENLKKEAMEAQTDYAELEQKLAEVSDEKKASDDLLEVKTAECIDLSAKYIASIDEAYSSKEALLTELNELKDSHQMVKMQFDSTIKEKDNRLQHISMSNDAIEIKFLEKSKECVAQSQQFEQAKSESNERAILLSKELSELKERLRDDTSEYQSTIQKIQRQLEETMVEKEVSDQLLEEKMKEGVYQAEKYDALAFQSKSKHELLSKELLSIKVSFENEKLGLESQIREKKKSFDDLTIEKEAINIQFLDKSNEYDSLVAESTKNFAIFEKKLTEGLELVEKLKKENAQFVTDIDKCEATLTSLLEELETTKKSKGIQNLTRTI
jgi:chromosome segregation ATPase